MARDCVNGCDFYYQTNDDTILLPSLHWTTDLISPLCMPSQNVEGLGTAHVSAVFKAVSSSSSMILDDGHCDHIEGGEWNIQDDNVDGCYVWARCGGMRGIGERYVS